MADLEKHEDLLLQTAAALHAARPAARFLVPLATRLTRTTRQLRVASPELALQRATASAVDFAGGTRIGDALKEFNDRWGRRGLARGAVVVIVSDGWDGGDPARVGEQMARLARLAHRIVWVNPRKQSDRYERRRWYEGRTALCRRVRQRPFPRRHGRRVGGHRRSVIWRPWRESR
jgi:uncharacterized protein with von Willebrand factor type A (vWA) domain